MTVSEYIRTFLKVIQQAWGEFDTDKGFKLSASLAYYTIFSISPMLIVIISLCGIFLGKQAIEGQIYEQINTMVGEQAALQIQEMIKNVSAQGNKSYIASIIGLGTLLIGATGVFAEIQSSINFIWGIKPKPKRGFLKVLLNRLLSFSLIISMGFILLVSLTLSGIILAFNQKLSVWLPGFSTELILIGNHGLTFLVISLLFAIIFKVLPDASIRWKDVMIGAIITALLFMLGRYMIGLYIGMSNLGMSYGAAASLVVILVWVYYSSIILYFGAEFTQVYADHFGKGVLPKSYSVLVKHRELNIQEISNDNH